MHPAFIAAQPLLAPVSPSRSAICTFDGMRKASAQESTSSNMYEEEGSVVMMGARRNLKKEKALRNLEFARAHRKRPVKFFNRRAAQEAIQNEDNELLSSLYGTIRFSSNKDQKDEEK